LFFFFKSKTPILNKLDQLQFNMVFFLQKVLKKGVKMTYFQLKNIKKTIKMFLLKNKMGSSKRNLKENDNMMQHHSIKKGIFLFVFCTLGQVHAQVTPSSVNVPMKISDATVVIHQQMLSKFLESIGDVSGVQRSGGIDYEWKVKNPKIVILKDKAEFKADVQLKTKGLNYLTPAYGDVEILYDPTPNLILVKVKNAFFDLYVDLFGKRMKLGEINLSTFYKAEFKFSGPKIVQTEIDLALPNGHKKMLIDATNRKLSLEPEKIMVTTDFVFSEKPSGNVPVASPNYKSNPM